MAWCDDCSRYWVRTSISAAGECPTCGRTIAEPVVDGTTAAKTPWHFKLLLTAVIGYLGLRAWQGIVWVVHHI